MVQFESIATPALYIKAAALFKEYAVWLGIDLKFQNFDAELADLPTVYGPPGGAIILGMVDGNCIACVAVRKLSADVAELKRMYVKPAWQGKGVGTNLLKAALEMAKNLGYATIKLDTLNHMHSAIQLYEKHGFERTNAYYHNPNETAVYMQKTL